MVRAARCVILGVSNGRLARRPWAWLALCGVLTAVTGCGRAPTPEFRLNMQDILFETDLNPDDFRVTGAEENEEAVAEKKARAEALVKIVSATEAFFGTPDEPVVLEETGLNAAGVRLASGPYGASDDGKQRGLYRQHCVHCHGISGDGAGPTAAFLNPYPRDYRAGKYKFKSTQRSAKPTHADLKRVLLEGIGGTAMPSFALLPDAEVEALVEYVKYLSLRGQFEMSLARKLLIDEEDVELTRPVLLTDFLVPEVEPWSAANELVIVPGDKPELPPEESIAAGKALFRGDKASCVKCHGPTGLGDGELDFDDWNKPKSTELALNAGKWLLPKRIPLPARNLRLGVYRGGRRPIDIYRRIHAGINGAPMPNGGPSEGSTGGLTNEEIWSLVDYVRSLPYEASNGPLGSEPTLQRAGL
jgi:mono/diheme cytochrome c family protein